MLQISNKVSIGTTTEAIYNVGGGDNETPQEVDQSKWLVAIHSSEPEHIKMKYKKDRNTDTMGWYWTYDPTFNVQVILW